MFLRSWREVVASTLAVLMTFSCNERCVELRLDVISDRGIVICYPVGEKRGHGLCDLSLQESSHSFTNHACSL